MDSPLGRLLVLLVGLVIGYWVGFKDAQGNEHMIVTRIIERVQTFGDRTVGEPQREKQEAVEEAGR